MDGSVTELPLERFGHGTRSRYVKGCRCAPCRDSNRLYYHQRQAVALERATELEQLDGLAASVLGPAPIATAPQVWTAPSGASTVRFYARACPGIDGPCPTRSHLRKDSKGGICRGCRIRLSFNGLVPAERARAHLLELGAAGVGRRAVSAACDVAASKLMEIRSGRQLQLRADTERRILAVDVGATADAAVIGAAPTWRAVRELQRMGWTKSGISRALGNEKAALQLGKRHVLARTALAVKQLLEREKRRRVELARARVAAQKALSQCPRCRKSHRDDPPALAWCLENMAVPVDELEVVG